MALKELDQLLRKRRCRNCGGWTSNPPTGEDEFIKKFLDHPNDPPKHIQICGHRYTLDGADGSQ